MRIKFAEPNRKVGDRIHALGDVVDVEEDIGNSLVEKGVATEADGSELTVFPEPETAALEFPNSPDGGQGGAAKAVAKAPAARR